MRVWHWMWRPIVIWSFLQQNTIAPAVGAAPKKEMRHLAADTAASKWNPQFLSSTPMLDACKFRPEPESHCWRGHPEGRSRFAPLPFALQRWKRGHEYNAAFRPDPRLPV